MGGVGVPGRGRVSILVAAVLLGALTAGCATVGEAQDPTSRADGDNASVSGIALRNIFVLGPMPAGEPIPAGGTAQIYLTLINNNAEPDRLVSVAAPDVARSVQLIGGPIALPPDTVIHPGEGPTMVLEELTRPLRGGDVVRLSFRFAEAGTVEVTVPVMPYAGFYTSYPATPGSTPTTTPATPVP